MKRTLSFLVLGSLLLAVAAFATDQRSAPRADATANAASASCSAADLTACGPCPLPCAETSKTASAATPDAACDPSSCPVPCASSDEATVAANR